AAQLTAGNRWRRAFAAPFFNEFVIRGADTQAAWDAARQRGVLAGVPLHSWYPELPDALLVCVTQVHDATGITALAQALGARDHISTRNGSPSGKRRSDQRERFAEGRPPKDRRPQDS